MQNRHTAVAKLLADEAAVAALQVSITFTFAIDKNKAFFHVTILYYMSLKKDSAFITLLA